MRSQLVTTLKMSTVDPHLVWGSSDQEVVSDSLCTLPAVTREVRPQVLMKTAQAPLPQLRRLSCHPGWASHAFSDSQTPSPLLSLAFIGLSPPPRGPYSWNIVLSQIIVERAEEGAFFATQRFPIDTILPSHRYHITFP